MHVLDLIIAAITIFLMVIGLKRGLIGEVIRLSAMIAGIFVAFLYYQEAAKCAPLKLIPVQLQIRYALSFILIYCLCAVAIIGSGWFIKKIIHLTPLGWIDSLVGGLIGLLKGLLIAYVACLSISSFPVRRVQNDFGSSIVYRSFKSLPKVFSLKSVLHNRERLRTMFNGKPSPPIDRVQYKFETFKAAVDSAKKAQESDTKRNTR